MKGLRQVIPYHHAAIFLKEPIGLHLSMKKVAIYKPDHPQAHNVIYQLILKTDQPVYLEDVNSTPAWTDVPHEVNLRTWMGVPLKNGGYPTGILSLARRTLSPFSKDEIDITRVFAEYIGISLRSHSKASVN